MQRFYRSAMALVTLVSVPAMAGAQDWGETNAGFSSRTRLVTGGDYGGTGAGGSVEFGVASLGRTTLSLGAFTGFQRESRSIGTLEVKTTVMPVMAIGNVHVPLRNSPRVDTYFGLSAGITRTSVESNSNLVGSDDDSRSDTGVGLQAGIRYRLLPRFGVVGQLGLGDLPRMFFGASLVL
jgi:hypothetical protein